ncbi:MAG: phage terminase large subunit family protein [Maricaulaceae bacterium]
MTDHAADLVDRAWRAGLRPEPALTVSEWADVYRRLPSTSAEPGVWRTDRAPYLREIMDALSPSNPTERVVLMKGAQTGGTEVLLIAVGYGIAHARGSMLVVWPSEAVARRNMRMRVEPMLEASPALKDRVAEKKSRDAGNTILQKEFPGGHLIAVGANAPGPLRSTPARYVLMDEVDAFALDLGGEGDPIALAEQRTVTFRGRRKILLVSTPTVKDFSRIETAYSESDQRRWHVPCQHCGAFFVIAWPLIKWPPNDRESAFLTCPECGGVHHEQDKPKLNAQGEWRPTAAGDGRTAGFHISALASPFETWGEIAAEHGRGYRDPARLKSWGNLKLGESWDDGGATIAPDNLANRAEDWGDQLPEPVTLITAGVDVQDDRLELEIVGWGPGEESWSLAYHVLTGDPSERSLWDDLDAVLRRKFPHRLNVADLGVAAAAVDFGGHFGTEVLEFTTPRHRRRIWAVKGRAGGGAPPWPHRPTYSKRGRQPIYVIGVDGLKETFVTRLSKTDTGPGACHFPLDRHPEYFRQLTVERPITRYKKGKPVREWHLKPGERNEAFDCRIYAMAALYGLKAFGVTLPARSHGAKPTEDLEPPALAPSPSVIPSSWMR